MNRPKQMTASELEAWLAADPCAQAHVQRLVLDRLLVADDKHIWVGGVGRGFGCIGRLP